MVQGETYDWNRVDKGRASCVPAEGNVPSARVAVAVNCHNQGHVRVFVLGLPYSHPVVVVGETSPTLPRKCHVEGEELTKGVRSEICRCGSETYVLGDQRVFLLYLDSEQVPE